MNLLNGCLKMEEYIIFTVKYAVEFVLLAKKQTLLGMLDRQTKIGRHYRMKINQEKLVKYWIWSIAFYGSES
jgi:hypothetical protein